jgi:serine/threonine protein phosphatase PrpC
MSDSIEDGAPTLREIDAWGVTHQGKVRASNQDHFFVGSLARGTLVIRSSTGDQEGSIVHPQRMASLAVVADGVGSAAGGGEAARVAVDDLVASVSSFCCSGEILESSDPEAYSAVLHSAALECHDSLLRKAEEAGGERTFATTLTLFLGFWPHAYLLQVGDSRCYIYQRDTLTCVTRDQTWAQELLDAGKISRTEAERGRWANVLSSAIGGIQATPVVTRITREFGAVIVLCSDGLTRHVPDERIASRVREMRDARQLAEQLVQDALDGGGADNITVVVGRTRHPEK